MSENSQRHSPQDKGLSLPALLEAIDQDVAPALLRDMAWTKEQSSRGIKRRKPHIAFVLGMVALALPIDSVQEIGEMPTITPLPNVPRWIRGIVQNRGEILSVVDFATLFGLEAGRLPGANRLSLLYRWQDLRFCLPVTKLIGIVNFDEQHDRLVPMATITTDSLGRLTAFVKGMFRADERDIFLLNSELLGTSELIRSWR